MFFKQTDIAPVGCNKILHSSHIRVFNSLNPIKPTKPTQYFMVLFCKGFLFGQVFVLFPPILINPSTIIVLVNTRVLAVSTQP